VVDGHFARLDTMDQLDQVCFISNAYWISDRVCRGIELLVMSSRARRLREASMM